MDIIPADATANQEMTIRFNDDVLRLTIIWNSIGSHWYMNVYDVETDLYIVEYLPLECGIPLGGRLGRSWVFLLADASGLDLDPVRVEDLGTRCILLIATVEEANALMALRTQGMS